jgi:hypothetical protein
MAVKVTERRSFFMYASNASGGPRKRTQSARNAVQDAKRLAYFY